MKKFYKVTEEVMHTDEYPKGRTYFFLNSEIGPNFSIDWFPKVKDNRALARFICEKLNSAASYAWNAGFDEGMAGHNTFCEYEK